MFFAERSWNASANRFHVSPGENFRVFELDGVKSQLEVTKVLFRNFGLVLTQSPVVTAAIVDGFHVKDLAVRLQTAVALGFAFTQALALVVAVALEQDFNIRARVAELIAVASGRPLGLLCDLACKRDRKSHFV